MIPPIQFMNYLVQFFFQIIYLIDVCDDEDDTVNHYIHMSFINLIQTIVNTLYFMQIMFDEFFESNKEWQAHRIITYLFGYR